MKIYIVYGWMSCILNRTLNQKLKNYLTVNNCEIVSDPNEAELILFTGCGVTESVEKFNIQELIYLENLVRKNNKGQKILLASCLKKINERTRGTHTTVEGETKEYHLDYYSTDLNSSFIHIDLYDYSLLDKLINAKVPVEQIREPNKIDTPSGMEAVNLSNKILLNKSSDNRKKLQRLFLRQAKCQSEVQLSGHFYPINADYLQLYGFRNINIGMGCKNNCAFCITKYAKSKIKSHTAETILEDIGQLVSEGHNKIQLICNDIGSWGLDIKSDWMQLLLKIATTFKKTIDLALFNIKIDDALDNLDLFKAIQSKTNLIYIGAMAQHTSQKILEAMNRKVFNKTDYVNFVNYFGNMGVHVHTYYVIGFPGENQEDMDDLKDSLSQITTPNFSLLNFPYSERIGTAGATLPGKLEHGTINQRLIEINKHWVETSKKRFAPLPTPIASKLTELLSLNTQVEECNYLVSEEYTSNSLEYSATAIQ